jgi:hypothetical protein
LARHTTVPTAAAANNSPSDELGRYSVWVEESFRMTFRFGGGHARDPAHPGEILKEMFMTPPGVTITQTAQAPGAGARRSSDSQPED